MINPKHHECFSEILKNILPVSKESCKWEEGSRQQMFKKSRELDGKEDDDSPPAPRWQLFHIR